MFESNAIAYYGIVTGHGSGRLEGRVWERARRGSWEPRRVLVCLHSCSLCAAPAVSNEELRGRTPEAAAQVVQWVSFADSDIVPPASTWVFPTLGIMHHNKQVSLGAWGKAGACWGFQVLGLRAGGARAVGSEEGSTLWTVGSGVWALGQTHRRHSHCVQLIKRWSSHPHSKTDGHDHYGGERRWASHGEVQPARAL